MLLQSHKVISWLPWASECLGKWILLFWREASRGFRLLLYRNCAKCTFWIQMWRVCYISFSAMEPYHWQSKYEVFTCSWMEVLYQFLWSQIFILITRIEGIFLGFYWNFPSLLCHQSCHSDFSLIYSYRFKGLLAATYKGLYVRLVINRLFSET